MTTHKTREERRQQILAAAAKCFARSGFYEASMDDIVAEAGLSKGSLYWHFENKRDLFKSLLDQWYTEMASEMQDALVEGTSNRSKLKALFMAVDRSAAARPEMLRAQMEFYTYAIRDAELHDWIQSMYQQFISVAEAIVSDGMAEGEFRRGDARAVACQIAALIDGVVLQREALRDTETVAPPWETLADTYLNLLEAS